MALKSVVWVAVLLVLLLYTCGILAQGFFGDSEALDRKVSTTKLWCDGGKATWGLCGLGGQWRVVWALCEWREVGHCAGCDV